MKLLLKLTLLLLLLPMTTQAQDRSAITKMDTMALKLYLREDYKKCAEVLQKQKNLVAKILTEKDTAYFANLRFQARCYFRLKDYEKAQKVAKEALDNWEQNHDLNNRSYILMLDNYATYLGSGDKPDYEVALKYAKDALERYEKLQKNDVDMAFILIHVAENSYDTKKYADALKYEIRALHIYKEIYGEHSDEYIGELEYLANYYDGNGQAQKAQEVRDLQEKLSKEKDKGAADLPPMTEFKTADECRAHKDDAMKIIDYYLHHLLTADQMSEAAGYIMNWANTTDLVTINLGEEEAALFTEKGLPYGIAYMAGCSEYALATDSAEFSKEMFRHAMTRVLNFYHGGNKDLTGKVPYLEKFIKENDKNGTDAAMALIDKYYEKLMKQVNNPKIKRMELGN